MHKDRFSFYRNLHSDDSLFETRFVQNLVVGQLVVCICMSIVFVWVLYSQRMQTFDQTNQWLATTPVFFFMNQIHQLFKIKVNTITSTLKPTFLIMILSCSSTWWFVFPTDPNTSHSEIHATYDIEFEKREFWFKDENPFFWTAGFKSWPGKRGKASGERGRWESWRVFCFVFG